MDYSKLHFNFVLELETSHVLFVWIMIYIQMCLQQCIQKLNLLINMSSTGLKLSSVVFDDELTSFSYVISPPNYLFRNSFQ